MPEELQKMLQQNRNTVIIDIRTEAEFTGKDKMAWKNIGRLKNAVNIPLATLNKGRIAGYENKPVVIYDMMMFDGDMFAYAKQLREYGIKDIYLLSGGISKVKEGIYDHQKNELISLMDE